MRHLVFLVLALAAASQPSSPQPAAAQAPRNVLLVVADDFGVDQVAAYGLGADLAITPNLDALAASSRVFLDVWSQPICSPTRSALLTGRLPFRTGVGDILQLGGYELPFEEITLPEALDLSGSGVAHAAIGKWHLSSTPTAAATGPLDQGFGHWSGSSDPVRDYYDWQHSVNGIVNQNTDYVTTVQVDEALSWIGAQTSPWFCLVAFHTPHAPYHAPPAGTYVEDLTGLDPTVHRRAFYKAMVESMDHELGRLLAGLGTEREETVVLFLGDNGTPSESIVAPLDPSKSKGTLYQGGVRIPLVASVPGQTAGTSRSLLHVTDLFATILELLGAAPPAGVAVDSISFASELGADPGPALQRRRLSVYSERFSPNGLGTPTAWDRAVRTRAFKLLRFDTHDEFYDLRGDPQEAVNLLPGGLTPEQQAQFDRLEQLLQRRGA